MDRIFLKKKSERDLLRSMLKGEMSIPDFLNEDISSENGLMVKTLVLRTKTVEDEIPQEYTQFLKDISKPSPVVGYLQATKQESLNVLNDFCNEEIDLRSQNFSQKS